MKTEKQSVKMTYLKRMRDLREDADLTQQQVADFLGTSQTMYARYERGANELPIRHLLTLCHLYHVSTDTFLGVEQDGDGIFCPSAKSDRNGNSLSRASRVALREFTDYLKKKDDLKAELRSKD